MLNTLIDGWMAIKRWRSRRSIQHIALMPSFGTPGAIGQYLASNFVYSGDDIGGLDDRYSHPGELQYWIGFNLEQQKVGVARVWPLHTDCDDVSAFAWLASQGMPRHNGSTMYLLRYRNTREMLQHLYRNVTERRPYWLYFHEVCVIEVLGDDGHPELHMIDQWFGHTRIDSLDAIVTKFEDTFDCKLQLQAVPYPFEVTE